LLHGSDEDALAGGQQVELGKVSDILSDAPRLRYIKNLHTCPGKRFLRRKSLPVFHPTGGCRLERSLAIGHAPPAAKPFLPSSRIILNSSFILLPSSFPAPATHGQSNIGHSVCG
jgi:hypothetical protein